MEEDDSAVKDDEHEASQSHGISQFTDIKYEKCIKKKGVETGKQTEGGKCGTMAKDCNASQFRSLSNSEGKELENNLIFSQTEKLGNELQYKTPEDNGSSQHHACSDHDHLENCSTPFHKNEIDMVLGQVSNTGTIQKNSGEINKWRNQDYGVKGADKEERSAVYNPPQDSQIEHYVLSENQSEKEDCAVQRNYSDCCSVDSVCDCPSVSTTTSALDIGRDSLNVCLMDEKPSFERHETAFEIDSPSDVHISLESLISQSASVPQEQPNSLKLHNCTNETHTDTLTEINHTTEPQFSQEFHRVPNKFNSSPKSHSLQTVNIRNNPCIGAKPIHFENESSDEQDCFSRSHSRQGSINSYSSAKLLPQFPAEPWNDDISQSPTLTTVPSPSIVESHNFSVPQSASSNSSFHPIISNGHYSSQTNSSTQPSVQKINTLPISQTSRDQTACPLAESPLEGISSSNSDFVNGPNSSLSVSDDNYMTKLISELSNAFKGQFQEDCTSSHLSQPTEDQISNREIHIPEDLRNYSGEQIFSESQFSEEFSDYVSLHNEEKCSSHTAQSSDNENSSLDHISQLETSYSSRSDSPILLQSSPILNFPLQDRCSSRSQTREDFVTSSRSHSPSQINSLAQLNSDVLPNFIRTHSVRTNSDNDLPSFIRTHSVRTNRSRSCTEPSVEVSVDTPALQSNINPFRLTRPAVRSSSLRVGSSIPPVVQQVKNSSTVSPSPVQGSFSRTLERSSSRVRQGRRQENSEGLGASSTSAQPDSVAAVSGGDANTNWHLRKPSWLRASMRRVTHFQLAEPPPAQLPPQLPPLATPDTVLAILENNRRPNSAPGGGALRSRRTDFPRRYSSYSATILNSSSVTNLTQAAEPVAVESPSSEDDEEEEDISSSSEGTRSPEQQQQQEATSDTENIVGSSPLGEWPHSLSSMLASLGCTLGLFNISRFAIYSVHFGANFIVQFLLLTLVLGIPMYTLNTCLGQCLCAGVMDMWHISPIFQGVGIALLVAQALIGVYSIVGVSWMFIYFRDSFITKQDHYRWAEPYQPYRVDSGLNGTWRLEETVPDYLNGIVLQRHNLAAPESSFGHLKFQVAFNLAVVWMIVFVSLSKGLKSYGKVVYVFSLFPVFGMLVLCTKLLGLTPTNTTHQVFPQTVWAEFFLNTKSWIAAMTEVFFTWGLFGAAAMQIASHNRHKHLLNRDTSLVVVLTLAVLLLAAFLANTCIAILSSHGYTYIPSSFEHMTSSGFLQRNSEPLPPSLANTPVRYMSHTTLIAGTRVIVPSADQRHHSGYQVLRLATELVPATLAQLGADAVSPFWAVLFYFVLILFGIAQQLCIWHCVITGIMAINAATLKSWETTITFFSCAGGFILGLPMTTELGIFVVYFLDYAVGCSWWIMMLYLLEIIAVFVVRGRPYSGETVVATLFNRAGCLQTWAAPMLIFTWNVILPVTLVVMCISVFRKGQFRDLYDWRTIGYEYWPVWTREVGCMLQILPIVVVPLVCIIQTCRYLSSGPRDILDRIQLLYRPSMSRENITSAPNSPTNSAASAPPASTNTMPTPAPETSVSAFEDPPPKYTPPPSYTTATGARIAKLLRQSFRRSVRRLTNALSDSTNNTQPPPPDYAAVLVEINRTLEDRDESEENQGPVLPTDNNPLRSTMTATDVANILRSSFRRNIQRNRDAERLVDGEVPIHHDGGNSPPAARVETESKLGN